MTQYWGGWGGGSTKQLFLLILYNFGNIGGGGGVGGRASLPPYSAVPDNHNNIHGTQYLQRYFYIATSRFKLSVTDSKA